MWPTLRHPSSDLTPDAVLQRLRTRLPGAMRTARTDTLLTDLSIDSLDIVELLCLIDDEFGVRFEQGQFDAFRTVGDLAGVVARASAEGGGR